MDVYVSVLVWTLTFLAEAHPQLFIETHRFLYSSPQVNQVCSPSVSLFKGWVSLVKEELLLL